MTDDEMRAMPIPTLQDEGLLFLWVTGRAMEIGRECLRVWGYTRVDEVIWVKTNQVGFFRGFFDHHWTYQTISNPAPARHSHRKNGPLAQSYERTHACWS
jgi:N6-adenosine-specific RNA methylase IME4